jgi:REP element-mobilizing transposase RayT
MSLRHRNSLIDNPIFFVTTTVINFLNVFTDPKACDILVSNIKHYQEKYHFTILAYVIMPSHFHWIVLVDNKYGTISDIMRDIKKYSAWEIMDYLSSKNDKTCFNVAPGKYIGQKRKFWMYRFHDEGIRNEKMFFTKLKYIHNNPVKAGIVDSSVEYKYCSAINYVKGDHSVLKVDTDYAGIEMV